MFISFAGAKNDFSSDRNFYGVHVLLTSTTCYSCKLPKSCLNYSFKRLTVPVVTSQRGKKNNIHITWIIKGPVNTS